MVELENAVGKIYFNGNNLVIVNENPAFADKATATILNMAGQTVLVENFAFSQGTTILPVGDLNRGIYLVAIEVNGDVITRKVAIQ